MRTIILVVMLAIFSGFVFGQDLSSYPEFLIDSNKVDAVIVVGDKAPAIHVIAQTQIALSLSSLVSKRTKGLSKLASEVDDIEDINVISVGNACDNELSAEILQYPEPCDKDLEPGKAMIEMFRTNAGTYHIVLNAYSDKGIKKASDVLSNYESYNFKGNVFETIVFEESQIEVVESEKEIILPDEEDNIETEDAKTEDDDERPVERVETKDTKLEFEETGPEPIFEEEDNLIKLIVAWFLSLFGK